MAGSAAGSIGRIASTTIAARHRRREQPFHGLLHAIIGRDPVDDEERVMLVVARDQLGRVAPAEDVDSLFSSVRCARKLAAQRVPTDRTTESGRAVAGNTLLASTCRPCSGEGNPEARDHRGDASRPLRGSECRCELQIVSIEQGSA